MKDMHIYYITYYIAMNIINILNCRYINRITFSDDIQCCNIGFAHCLILIITSRTFNGLIAGTMFVFSNFKYF